MVPYYDGFMISIAVTENYAYISASTSSSVLEVIDIRNKTNPQRISTLLSPEVYTNLWVQDGILYAASDYQIQLWDITNRLNPVLLTTLFLPERYSESFSVSDNKIFVANYLAGLVKIPSR